MIDLMPLIKLNTTADEKEIRAAIEAWVEMLATNRFVEAVEATLHREDVGWTPELMRTVISNYGSPDVRWDRKIFHVTSPTLLNTDESYFGTEIFDDDPNRPQQYVGMAMYNVPLNGEWSDLTAIFDLIQIEDNLFLSLDDIHVM